MIWIEFKLHLVLSRRNHILFRHFNSFGAFDVVENIWLSLCVVWHWYLMRVWYLVSFHWKILLCTSCLQSDICMITRSTSLSWSSWVFLILGKVFFLITIFIVLLKVLLRKHFPFFWFPTLLWTPKRGWFKLLDIEIVRLMNNLSFIVFSINIISISRRILNNLSSYWVNHILNSYFLFFNLLSHIFLVNRISFQNH